jgi:hypothetical protein
MLFTHKGKKFHQDILSYNNGEIFYEFHLLFIEVMVRILYFRRNQNARTGCFR